MFIKLVAWLVEFGVFWYLFGFWKAIIISVALAILIPVLFGAYKGLTG